MDRVFPLADGVTAASVRDAIARDLRDLAKTKVVATDDALHFSIGHRWWNMGGPWDLVDGGEIRFDPERRQLSYTLSMNRTLIGGVLAASALGAGGVFLIELPPWMGLLSGVGAALFFTVGNVLTADLRAERYFGRMAAGSRS